MKILCDENIANKIKEGLIELGIQDVKHINDIGKGIPDKEVYKIAEEEKRILITGDDDFKDKDYKYKIPIIWITPRARMSNNVPLLVEWILNHIQNYKINIEKSFITIRKEQYVIEYRTKDGIFGKVKTREIEFSKIKQLCTDKR